MRHLRRPPLLCWQTYRISRWKYGNQQLLVTHHRTGWGSQSCHWEGSETENWLRLEEIYPSNWRNNYKRRCRGKRFASGSKGQCQINVGGTQRARTVKFVHQWSVIRRRRNCIRSCVLTRKAVHVFIEFHSSIIFISYVLLAPLILLSCCTL